jgi:hypothetical protein
MAAVMKAVLAFALAWTDLALGSATMAQAAQARADRITVAYVPPKNSSHQGIYERVKEIRFLEKVQELLSPFRLPRSLRVKTEGCDGDANASYENDTITICYEYVDDLWKNVPAQTTPGGVTPVDALLGPLVDTSLHEFGHAVFDMLRVPTFGREEDAADQVSAYIMLRLGKAEARRLFLGTAYAYKTEFEAATAPPALTEFSNVHGTPSQRFYNLLCIGYGADAQLFGDLVAKGYLPKDRAEDCASEYKQVAFAFQKLISPHIDARRARRVFDKNWLPEPTRQVPRRPDSMPAQPQ